MWITHVQWKYSNFIVLKDSEFRHDNTRRENRVDCRWKMPQIFSLSIWYDWGAQTMMKTHYSLNWHFAFIVLYSSFRILWGFCLVPYHFYISIESLEIFSSFVARFSCAHSLLLVWFGCFGCNFDFVDGYVCRCTNNGEKIKCERNSYGKENE